MVDFANLHLKVTSSGIDEADKDLTKLQGSAGKTEKHIESLVKTIGRLKALLAVGFGIQGIQTIIQMTDKMTSLNAQVKFVTSSTKEFSSVQDELFNISQRTRGSLEATTTLYVRSSRALKDYGYSQKQVLGFTETLNKAMAVGGVGAQEQATALFQLSQALGSGRLQGDEFRAISESAPIILDVVAEYMGKSRAEVKKLASEGQITSRLIFEAISSSSQKINKKFEEMPLTFGQAMTQMENATLKFVSGIDNSLSLTKSLAEGVSYLASNFEALVFVIGTLSLAHISKFVSATALATLNTVKQNKANIDLVKSTRDVAVAELHLALIEQKGLQNKVKQAKTTEELVLARSRLTLHSIKAKEAEMAAEVATRNLATAQRSASITGRALSGVMSLLGGPAGIITIAASALFYFYQNAEQARDRALDLTGANERLKQSYEDLSEAVLLDTIRKQIEELKNSREQVKGMEYEIGNTQKIMNQFLGLSVPDKLKIELETLKDKLAKLKEGEGINFSTLEKQLGALVPIFVNSGRDIEAFRKKLLLLGIGTKDVETIMKSLEKSFTDSIQKSKGVSVGYNNIESELKKLKERTEEARQKLDILNLKQQVNEKSSYVLSQLYDVLGEKGAEYASVLRAIAVSNYVAAQSELSHIKDAKFSLEELIAMKKEAESAFVFNSSADQLSSSTQDKLNEWKSFYNELKKASADSLTQISLNEEQALRDMLDKAKKAKIGHEEMERAKTLITEKYAKERLEIAEKYAVDKGINRRLYEQLKEIEQLRSSGAISGDDAKYVSNKARWDSAYELADVAKEKSVSFEDRLRGTYDPAQEEMNKLQERLAFYQSLNDQKLLSDQGLADAQKKLWDDYNLNKKNQELNMYADSFSAMSSALMDTTELIGKAAGKQSGIYKAMFAASKAFAIAESIVKIQQGIANASALPWPQNLSAIASVISATSSIVSTISGTTMNLSGQAHSGIDNIPREGTWLLDKGERVVDSRTNQDLKKFLANQQKGSSNQGKPDIKVNIINNGEQVKAKADVKEKGGQLEVTVELIRQISKQVVNETIEDNFRQGGVFA
ncbi:tape measure protein [Pasteurella multocida]|nr:tape measure protein [Pasteurella multocida]MDY0678171.1 tape measure protein [Pasteurella multocida]MDY0682455.1 tape measure protein [Pasteurella multocida]